jgi:hypothetical protein
VSAGEAYRARGTYWRAAGRRVLLPGVRKDGKEEATLGIAAAAEERESWRERVYAWACLE